MNFYRLGKNWKKWLDLVLCTYVPNSNNRQNKPKIDITCLVTVKDVIHLTIKSFQLSNFFFSRNQYPLHFGKLSHKFSCFLIFPWRKYKKSKRQYIHICLPAVLVFQCFFHSIKQEEMKFFISISIFNDYLQFPFWLKFYVITEISRRISYHHTILEK